jgi:hypothetical protein
MSQNRQFLLGNISSGNQPLRANYGNFNLSHTILIQGRAYGRWKGWFAKFMGDGRGDLQRCFCKLLLPPPLNAPLGQHRVSQIETRRGWFPPDMLPSCFPQVLLYFIKEIDKHVWNFFSHAFLPNRSYMYGYLTEL